MSVVTSSTQQQISIPQRPRVNVQTHIPADSQERPRSQVQDRPHTDTRGSIIDHII